MSKFLDIACNAEFPSDELYLKHKRSGHKDYLDQAVSLDSPPVPPSPPTGLPEGIPATAMPSAEFMAQVQRIESKQEEALATTDSQPSQHPSVVPPADPIVLQYLYTGVCPDDRAAIQTIELDVNEKHFCVAVCSTCKKQLMTKEVNKL